MIAQTSVPAIIPPIMQPIAATAFHLHAVTWGNTP